MDTFEHAVRTGKISSEATLRRMYRRLSKSVHPDTTDSADEAASHERFVRLKADYDAASGLLAQSRKAGRSPGIDTHGDSRAERGADARADEEASARARAKPDFFACSSLFCDLMAGNFPLGGDVRQNNKLYLSRVRKLDAEVSKFGKEYAGLVPDVERELYAIRGNSMVSSHAFNLVQLYLKNLSVYLLMGNLFSRLYLIKERDSAIECLKGQNAHRCVFFLEWMLRESRALDN